MGTKDSASVLVTGSSWEGHRCGKDPAGPCRAARRSLRNGSTPCLGRALGSVVGDAGFGIRMDGAQTPTPPLSSLCAGHAAGPHEAQVAPLSLGGSEKRCGEIAGAHGLRHSELVVARKARPKLSIRKITDV